MNRQLILAVLLTSAAWGGCTSEKGTSESAKKPTANYAFITNGVAGFWDHVRAGADKAGKDFGVNVSFITPEIDAGPNAQESRTCSRAARMALRSARSIRQSG